MTEYTILSASYANAEHTAAAIVTAESGAKLASATDTPEWWPAVLAHGPAPFTPPPAPVLDISDRQFFQALANAAIITPAEALAAVKTGDVPAVLQAIVDTIADAGERFATQMILSGATTFSRAHPLTEAVRLARGMSVAECDDFFRAAALL